MNEKATNMKTVIYGAQGIALSVFEAYRLVHPEEKIECFLVSKRGDNKETLAGLPVYELEDYSKLVIKKNNVKILVSTPANVMDEICILLNNEGYSNIILIKDEELNNLFTKASIKGLGYTSLYGLPAGREKASMEVFMACSKYDKQLRGKHNLPSFFNLLHVGEIGNEVMGVKLFDNVGDNISNKNRNYCELTGLYWIWKNELSAPSLEEKYYGYCQYRRILDLSENDLERIKFNDVDVVLPFPLTYEPNIEFHRKRYIKDADWFLLMKVLEELHPEYLYLIKKVLLQRHMFNYNVLLAKKQVIIDYCEWLFPILKRVEKLSIPKGDERADRYIGYMGETLETIYFMMNKDKYRIVHAGCKMLV